MARIRSREVESGSVNARMLRDDAVTRRSIKRWAVGYDEIQPGVVADRHLHGSTLEAIRQIVVGSAGLDSLFYPLEVALPSVAAGAEISGSTPWASRSLCNLLRVTMSVDTELELMLLRKPVFDATNRGKHMAFYSIGVGNQFMREGGSLFDYQDEVDGGFDLHYWIHNVGLSTTVPTLVLNKRVPQ